MEKVIVDDKNIRNVVRYKYVQNDKVIDLSDLDTSKCTNISFLFDEMSKLEEIKGFNSLNLSNIKDMSYMCFGCTSLKELDLSGLDLHNVMNMSFMCNYCTSLKELNLSGSDLSNVSNMYCMCYSCYSLKELDLSGLDLHNVKETFEMCWDCDLLIDFKVDEQYRQLFKDVIDGVSTRRDRLSSINFNMLKIPPHEE